MQVTSFLAFRKFEQIKQQVMKRLIFIVAMLLSIYGFAQKPQIRYKVNVERDSNGNIIRYDSTYVMTWSSNGQNPVDIDSLMQSMGIAIMPLGEQLNGKDTTQSNILQGFGMQEGANMPNDYINSMNQMMKQMEEMHKQMLKEIEKMQNMYGTNPQHPLAVPDTSTSEKMPTEKLKAKSVNL